MNRNILFKTVIDILFILQGFGILGAFIVMPFGVTKINQINANVEEWSALSWVLLVTSLICYLMFMIGIFYLRKVGRYLLSNSYFREEVISNLKKSGRFLIYTGFLNIAVFIISWSIKLGSGEISLYSTDVALPLFITAIGLFFIIQSDSLEAAKNYKQENDLTI